MPRRHPNTLGKRGLRDAVRFQFLEQSLERAMLQIASDIRKTLYTLHGFGCDNRELARLPQKGQSQALTMVTMAMFADIATAGRGETAVVELHRDGIGAVIPDDFGGDLRARPDPGKERVDIGFGFLTGYTRPLTFDRCLELCECCIGPTYTPGWGVTKSVAAAMIST